MSWFTELGSKVVAGAGKYTGKAAAWVIGNPVASRVAGGALVGTGLQDLTGELGKNKNLRSPGKMIKAGFKIVAGGILSVFNDLSWYSNTGEESVASGLNYSRKRYEGPNAAGFIDNHGVAIELFSVVPSDMYGSFEQQIRQLWKNIRQANSGAVNYSQDALLHYVTNIRNVFTVYAELVRLYGLLNAYNTFDTQLPTALLKLIGCPDDLISNLTINMGDFRMMLVRFAIKISTLYPVFWDAIKRTNWLVSNIFLDDDNSKAVPMMFIVDGNFTYFDQASGKFARWYDDSEKKFIGNSHSLEDLEVYFQGVVSTVDAIPGVDILTGDIMHAYGVDAIPDIYVPDEGYICPFSYSEEVLTQIQNISGATTTEFDDQRGTLGAVSTQPQFTYSVSAIGDGPAITGVNFPQSDTEWGVNQQQIVNAPMVNPSILEQISYTRLSTATILREKVGSVGSRSFAIDFKWDFIRGCSGEAVTGMRFAYSDSSEVMSYKYYDIRGNFIAYRGSTEYGQRIRAELILPALWSQCDWLPRLDVIASVIIPGSAATVVEPFVVHLFDSKVFAEYSYSQKQTYDGIAISSMYTTPMLVAEKRTDRVENIPGQASSGKRSRNKNKQKREGRKDNPNGSKNDDAK